MVQLNSMRGKDIFWLQRDKIIKKCYNYFIKFARKSIRPSSTSLLWIMGTTRAWKRLQLIVSFPTYFISTRIEIDWPFVAQMHAECNRIMPMIYGHHVENWLYFTVLASTVVEPKINLVINMLMTYRMSTICAIDCEFSGYFSPVWIS